MHTHLHHLCEDTSAADVGLCLSPTHTNRHAQKELLKGVGELPEG